MLGVRSNKKPSRGMPEALPRLPFAVVAHTAWAAHHGFWTSVAGIVVRPSFSAAPMSLRGASHSTDTGSGTRSDPRGIKRKNTVQQLRPPVS